MRLDYFSKICQTNLSAWKVRNAQMENFQKSTNHIFVRIYDGGKWNNSFSLESSQDHSVLKTKYEWTSCCMEIK
jgi:hypothetical protein